MSTREDGPIRILPDVEGSGSTGTMPIAIRVPPSQEAVFDIITAAPVDLVAFASDLDLDHRLDD